MPSPAADAPKLTEEQVANVMSQLSNLEKDIMAMRGNTLSTVLAELRSAAESDAAAARFYLKCDAVVNSDRKELDKVEARRREENAQRALEQQRKGQQAKSPADEDGENGFAIRLGLQYLILTLEAHETKDEDLDKMVPKLQAFISQMVNDAPKLKGRAMNMFQSCSRAGGPVVEALQIQRYLNRAKWSSQPGNVGSIYQATLFPLAEEKSRDSLPTLWDSRILAEGTMKKATLTEPEFELWTKNELPLLRWERARYLYKQGPSPINALADMLKVIKENPGHPDAPKWVAEMRVSVNQSAPTPVSESQTKPSGS